MKSRVEVNELGEFVLIIPEDVVDAYSIDDGDLIDWDTNDDDFVILSVA